MPMYAFRVSDPQLQAFLDDLKRNRQLTRFLNDLIARYLEQEDGGDTGMESTEPEQPPPLLVEERAVQQLTQALVRLYRMPESTARTLAQSPALTQARRLYGAFPEVMDEITAPLAALIAQGLLEKVRAFYRERGLQPPGLIAEILQSSMTGGERHA